MLRGKCDEIILVKRCKLINALLDPGEEMMIPLSHIFPENH